MEVAMTTPHGTERFDVQDDANIGIFTPHAANEGEATEWLSEALPTDEHEIVRGAHVETHLPHGWHDFGAIGWAGVVLMASVLALVIWGYVLPWLGVTRMWAIDPLR
jgi:hypothetical protein